jgi:hypothetical protein
MDELALNNNNNNNNNNIATAAAPIGVILWNLHIFYPGTESRLAIIY